MSFTSKYKAAVQRICGPVKRTDGCLQKDIKAAEKRLGFALPEALRDYYQAVGRHPINSCHNRLAELIARKNSDAPLLDVAGDWLYFYEEHQNVCEWMIKISECGKANPTVFQDQSGDAKETYAEGACADFLVSLLYWQGAMGGANFCAIATIAERQISIVESKYEFLSEMGGLRTFGSDSLAAGIAKNDLYVAAAEKDAFLKLDALLKVKWSYSSIDRA